MYTAAEQSYYEGSKSWQAYFPSFDL